MSNEQHERTGVQGWKSILATKHELLYQYKLARKYSKSHTVQTFHGNVAEAVFREWLKKFLPQKYGVTSGYVISQGRNDSEKMPHYDVIIYDQLEAPVLWTEGNPDSSKAGQFRAIPAEYIYGIIEVKAALNKKSSKEAMEKLQELVPLLQMDKPNERYRKYLPANFCCATVFFELREKDQYDESILNNLIPNPLIRGYYGGIVLAGENKDEDNSAKIRIMCGDNEMSDNLIPGKDRASLLTTGFVHSNSFPIGDKCCHITFMWSPTYFTDFAFDLISCMNGTFNPLLASSMHGLSYYK